MYLERDAYLLENQKDFADDRELYEYLSEKFGLEVTPYRGSYSTFNTEFLTYLGYYVTSYELGGLFSSFYSTGAGRTKLTKMATRKVLGQVRFVVPDGGSRSAYHLSRDGIENVLGQLPNDLRTEVKLRRSGGKVPVHDYATGMCMLQLLLTPYRFNFRKEYSVAREYGKDKGSLCIDAYVNIKSDYPYALAIEQDMGTESTATLVSKLFSYQERGLTTQRGLSLVVACHSNVSLDECPSFMLTHLNEVYEGMAAAGMDSLYDYYVKYGSILSEKGQKTLTYLMLRVGVLKAINSKGTNIELSSYRYGQDTVCKLKSAQPFTLKELSRYIEELNLCRNPYYQRAYNMFQYANARGTFRSMVRLLKRLLDDGAYDRAELSCLLKGFTCFVSPTALLSNYTKYITPRIYGMERIYYDCCHGYFPGMDLLSYSEYSPMLYPSYGNMPSCLLRNCYKYDKGIVCFENLSHDVGAFMRCLYLMRYGIGTEESLQIVAVCDNSQDAYFLADLLNMYHTTHAVRHEGVFLSYVLTGDLTEIADSDTSGTRGRLRGVTCITGKPKFIFLDAAYVGGDKTNGKAFISSGTSPMGISEGDTLKRDVVEGATVKGERTPAAGGNLTGSAKDTAKDASACVTESVSDVGLKESGTALPGTGLTMDELADMLFSGMPSDDEEEDEDI